MRTKGLGPQGLGISGNNGYHIGSPNKMLPVAAAAAGGGGGKKATTSRSSGDPGASMNAAPIKCWKTHKRKPGTVKGAKGSCIKK